MKILVADDEVHITTLLKITLEMNDFQVILASDGVEVWEKVMEHRPDLILLDIKMPRMNGWQVCEKIRSDERTKDIPIIVITAFGQKETRQRCIDLGVDDFIAKPFESTFLLERIQKILTQSEKEA